MTATTNPDRYRVVQLDVRRNQNSLYAFDPHGYRNAEEVLMDLEIVMDHHMLEEMNRRTQGALGHVRSTGRNLGALPTGVLDLAVMFGATNYHDAYSDGYNDAMDEARELLGTCDSNG